MRRASIFLLALMLGLASDVRAGDLWGDPLPGQDPPGGVVIVPDPTPSPAWRDLVHWRTDLDAARREAMRGGKLLFVLYLQGNLDDELC